MRERIVPELHWHGLTRFLELIERPWRLIYRIDGSTVCVVSALDGRRQLEDLLLARFLRHEFITRLCGGSLNSDCRVWIKADRRIFLRVRRRSHSVFCWRWWSATARNVPVEQQQLLATSSPAVG